MDKQRQNEMQIIYGVPTEHFNVLSSAEIAFYRFIYILSESNYEIAIEAFPRFYGRVLEHAKKYYKTQEAGQ